MISETEYQTIGMPYDKTSLVDNSVGLQVTWQLTANNWRILGEDDIKAAIDSYLIHLHRLAADCFGGVPLPVDEHCEADRCALGASQFDLSGSVIAWNFTIMKALYHVSYLSARTEDTPETPITGQLGCNESRFKWQQSSQLWDGSLILHLEISSAIFMYIHLQPL